MTLKSNIRGRDIAARYGGEEFAAILPETDLEGAVILADNIRKAIQAKELLSARPTRSSDASPLRSASRLTARAIRRRPSSSVPDRCLYAAKHAGRNRVISENELTPDDVVAA